jgi:LemA protein
MSVLANAYFPAGVAVAVLALLGAWVAIAFNRLVRNRNLLDEAFSGIDVQLKRRHNLITNLVETVKAYGLHEKTVLEEVVNLRAQTTSAGPTREIQDSENALTDGLKRLLALAEDYPDLKASRNFLGLQDSLREIEDQLQMARRYYNGTVRNYNILAQSFPGNIVARLFGFGPKEFFQIITTSEREAPKVEI